MSIAFLPVISHSNFMDDQRKKERHEFLRRVTWKWDLMAQVWTYYRANNGPPMQQPSGGSASPPATPFVFPMEEEEEERDPTTTMYEKDYPMGVLRTATSFLPDDSNSGADELLGRSTPSFSAHDQNESSNNSRRSSSTTTAAAGFSSRLAREGEHTQPGSEWGSDCV